MKSIWLALACLLAVVAPARGEEQHAHAALFARVVGDRVEVAVEIQVDKGWHMYSGPTLADIGPEGALAQPTVPTLEGAGFTWGDWRFPEAQIEHQDFGTPIDVKIHSGKVVLYRAGTKGAEAKLESLALSVKGQTCNEGEGGVCLPFDIEAKFGGAGPDALFAEFPKDLTSRPKPPASDSRSGTLEEEPGNESSLLAFMVSAVLYGLFALLMPCTYPMIPITISFFTKQATARHTGTFALSLAYGGGIIGSFILIGVLIGPLIIPFANHPITNLVVAILFIVFALALLGVITLNPPRFLMNAAGSASQKGGYLGVFLMGLTLVVTSFTCTGPFVGTLLSTGAAAGGVGRIALGMGVFGLTLAVPFMWLSMVPSKLKSMPKSGEWMHTLKVFLGFLEIAAALKFLSNADIQWQWEVLTRELFLGLWAAVFFVAAAYLFGWIRLKDEYGQEEPATVSPKRLLGGLATLLFAVYCFYGTLGFDLDQYMKAMAPPYSRRIESSIGAGTGKARAQHTIVYDDFDAALALAKKENKQLLVNFTGFV